MEELTTLELTEKIASLYSIPPQHIHRVYRQGPAGIHVVVSNEVSWPGPQEEPQIPTQEHPLLGQGVSVFYACCLLKAETLLTAWDARGSSRHC